jgi:hypothetical protein
MVARLVCVAEHALRSGVRRALELAGSTPLYAAVARCCDPTPGRWLEDDPVGFAAGDINLYRFVNTEQRGILLNPAATVYDA